MGGIWEKQIRSIRSILSSLFKTHGSSVNDETFRTIMAEATAIINSRPLTTDSLDRSDDPVPLSPSSLLTMKTKVILPPPGSFQRSDMFSRKYWRHAQHIANEFWLRWKKEYLTSLQRRTKWNVPQKKFQRGDIVLSAEDNLPRNKCLKARIADVQKDDKGAVQSVKLKIANAQFSVQKPIERPISKVVLLYREGE